MGIPEKPEHSTKRRIKIIFAMKLDRTKGRRNYVTSSIRVAAEYLYRFSDSDHVELIGWEPDSMETRELVIKELNKIRSAGGL